MSSPHKVGDIICLTRDSFDDSITPAWGILGALVRPYWAALFITADGSPLSSWSLSVDDVWHVVPDDEIPDDVLIALAKYRLNPTKGE